VIKWFPPELKHRAAAEVRAYQKVSFAAPELLDYDEQTIVVERCIPMTRLPKKREHALAMRRMLERIHEAGINHCDPAVSNAVWHRERGLLLIDWEVSIEARHPELSYDLHGAAAVGMSWRVPAHQQPNGVWWGGPHSLAPAIYWAEVL